MLPWRSRKKNEETKRLKAEVAQLKEELEVSARVIEKLTKEKQLLEDEVKRFREQLEKAQRALKEEHEKRWSLIGGLWNLSRRFGIPFDPNNPSLEGFSNFIEELMRRSEECEAQRAKLTTSSSPSLSQPPTLKFVNVGFMDLDPVEDFLELDEETSGWARKVFKYVILGYNLLQMAKMLKVRKRGVSKDYLREVLEILVKKKYLGVAKVIPRPFKTLSDLLRREWDEGSGGGKRERNVYYPTLRGLEVCKGVRLDRNLDPQPLALFQYEFLRMRRAEEKKRGKFLSEKGMIEIAKNVLKSGYQVAEELDGALELLRKRLGLSRDEVEWYVMRTWPGLLSGRLRPDLFVVIGESIVPLEVETLSNSLEDLGDKVFEYTNWRAPEPLFIVLDECAERMQLVRMACCFENLEVGEYSFAISPLKRLPSGTHYTIKIQTS